MRGLVTVVKPEASAVIGQGGLNRSPYRATDWGSPHLPVPPAAEYQPSKVEPAFVGDTALVIYSPKLPETDATALPPSELKVIV